MDLSTKEVVIPEIKVEEPQRYEVVAEHHEPPKQLPA